MTGGECEGCKWNRLALRRKANGDSDRSTLPAIVQDVLRSPGRPLDEETRTFFEPRFGHDFSRVRVHADALATKSAEAVDALAYTVGAHIVFAPDEYRPNDAEGQKLLAHELAHTVQQARFAGMTPHASLEIGPADSPLEREADRIADQRTAGSPAPLGLDPGSVAGPALSLARPTLQRDKNKKNEPLIPIPVFDELDPMIIVPDVPGVPSFLRGRQVKLSTLRSALDVLRGNLPSLGGPGEDFCTRLLPGYETAHGGDVNGLCCPQFVRDRDRCCRWQDIGLMSFRCCTADEVVISDRCVRPERAPTPPTPPIPAPGGLTFPTIPRLELQFSHIPFGTIQSDTIDHFALNRPEVPSTPAATAALDRLASQLKLYGDAEAHVEGHTDSSYTEEYNQRLSEQRAQEVRDALVRRGIDGRRITTQGFGETRLLFPGEANAEEKARNRRVDVWFYIPRSRGFSEELQLRPPTLEGPTGTTP